MAASPPFAAHYSADECIVITDTQIAFSQWSKALTKTCCENRLQSFCESSELNTADLVILQSRDAVAGKQKDGK